jgi:cytochrome b subunit of formate dehydrogenase
MTRNVEEQMSEGTATKMNPAKTLAKGQIRAERVFAHIDRYAAWLSAILLFLFLVSGFGMTKPDFVSRATAGLITWRVAYDMHSLLYIPLMITFTVHTFTGLRRALARRTKRRRKSAWVAASLGTAVLAYLLILAFAPTGF